MTQQLDHQQIAWRVAQDLPRGACVQLGAGMPQLVPSGVEGDCGITFARFANGDDRGAQVADYCILGAREVAVNGDVVVHDARGNTPSASSGAPGSITAGAQHVFVMATYFAPDGRPTLVPECTATPSAARCVTRLYTDIAVIDLHDGKAWLREIVEGITLHVLQAETDVQLHMAPDLRLLHVPNLR